MGMDTSSMVLCAVKVFFFFFFRVSLVWAGETCLKMSPKCVFLQKFFCHSFRNISQIDLAFGFWRRTYVECKCYSGPVPLKVSFPILICALFVLTTKMEKDVAKFSSVLELNGISLSRGLFVTNSTYVPRATTIGIKCIDGTRLAQLKKQARFRGVFFPLALLSSVVGMVVTTQYLP
jgi:hypothetical protein